MPYYIHIRKAEVWAETKASPASYPGQVALSKRKLGTECDSANFPDKLDRWRHIRNRQGRLGTRLLGPQTPRLGCAGGGASFCTKKEKLKKKKKRRKTGKKHEKTETGKEKKSQFCFYYSFLLPTKEKSNKERGTPNGYYISIDTVKSHNVTIMDLDIIIEMHAPLSSLMRCLQLIKKREFLGEIVQFTFLKSLTTDKLASICGV